MSETSFSPDPHDEAWEILDRQGQLSAAEIRQKLGGGGVAHALDRLTSFPVDSQGRRIEPLPPGVVPMKDASEEAKRALEEAREYMRNRQS